MRGISGATNNVATCTGYGYGYLNGTGYASPAPQLTLFLSRDVTVSKYPVTAFGTLTQAGCVLPNQTVILKRRAVIAGFPNGSFVTYSTTTTDSNGNYSVTFNETYNSQFQASAPGAAGRPAVNSPTRVLRLFARVGAHASSGSHLSKARICGTTAPPHVGTPIVLYRGSGGVWHPIQAKRVLADKSYCFQVFLPAGRTPIKVRMYSTDTNLFGQRAFYVRRG